MNEKPILFSAAMVLAILEGRKTQTRRVIMPQIEWDEAIYQRRKSGTIDQFTFSEFIQRCFYGEVGDRLWVRETWKCEELEPYGEDGVRFRADGVFRGIENSREASQKWADANREGGKWRPSIFMPRWASRITLEVVNVRVERVQEISEEDAMAEGVTSPGAKLHFRKLWDEINDKRGFGWDANPWVWVVEFTPIGLSATSPKSKTDFGEEGQV